MTAAIALLAGGGAAPALRLGSAMTLLQFSIGALNDLVDAPRDAIGQPSKPIPAGAVTATSARLVATACAGLGLVLLVPIGPAVVGLGVVVLAIGYAYDLVLKGTPWSWVPFAIGIPILPVFAWFGAAGRVPSVFAALLPAAVAAGAALALANSLVDLDGDRAGAVRSPAQSWGADRARNAATALLVLVALVAVTTAFVGGASPLGVVAIGAVAVVLVAAGRWLTAPERQVRERAWEAQAALTGALAAAWLAVLAAAGRLG